MTFGNAVGALAVCVLLLGLASDSRSPSSRPTDLTANQEARPAPAPVKEPLARDAATPRPPEIAPQPVEPVKPSTPAPAAKPPATSSAPPPGRTAAGGLATKERPATGAEPQPRSTPPSDVVPPQPATPAAATLDLRSLEQRLRDTTAIGVFTKLSLKNQVDDLLREFREFHKSHDQTMLATLRQSFDLLLLKVLSLLQDSDPGLARDISSSRDELWSILTDPEKFKNVE